MDSVEGSQYGVTTGTPPTLYVPLNQDPMIRVYEKLIKIREREQKFLEMEKPKESETPKKESVTPPIVIVIEDEKPSRFRKSFLDKKYKTRHKWSVTKHRETDDKPLHVVRKELQDDSKGQMKLVWEKYIGSFLEDDTIEREWKLLLGEEDLGDFDAPANRKSEHTHRSKSTMYQGTSLSEDSKYMDKPLTRRELIELYQAQKKALDMKFVDACRKEPMKQTYNQNLIKSLQKRISLGTYAKIFKQTKKKRRVTTPSVAAVKEVIVEEPDIGRLSQEEDDFDLKPEQPSAISIVKEEEQLQEKDIPDEKEESFESYESWSSCPSMEESVKIDEIAYKKKMAMLPFILEHEEEGEILEEEEMVYENLWKYLEQLAPKESTSSLNLGRPEEKRKESDSSQTEDSDIYIQFKKRQRKTAEKERKEGIIRDKLHRRLDKLEKLKDPLYWQSLMEEAMYKEPFLEEDEIDDYEFENFIEKLEEEDILFGEEAHEEEEEEIEEEEKEEKIQETSPKKMSIHAHFKNMLEGEVEQEEEEQEQEEQEEQEQEEEERDIKRLSDTKTNSTVLSEHAPEEEKSLPKSKISFATISPKARYFNSNYPELFASDTSLFPSYTDLKRPYVLVCADRIKFMMHSFKKLFRNEFLSLQRRHTFAFGGVQFARQFIIGIRVPRRFPDPYTYKEKNRLDNILKE